MLRSGALCISADKACAAPGLAAFTFETACECAHSHDSARSGNSVLTCVAVRLIEGSGRPARNAGNATCARSTTTSTSHGWSWPVALARAGVSNHGKSGGSKSTIAR